MIGIPDTKLVIIARKMYEECCIQFSNFGGIKEFCMYLSRLKISLIVVPTYFLQYNLNIFKILFSTEFNFKRQ